MCTSALNGVGITFFQIYTQKFFRWSRFVCYAYSLFKVSSKFFTWQILESLESFIVNFMYRLFPIWKIYIYQHKILFATFLTSLDVEVGLQLYFFGGCRYCTCDFCIVSKFWYLIGEAFINNIVMNKKTYGAKYWTLWHTTYNVSSVRWFTVYKNALFSLWKPVFKPPKNFLSYAMWLKFS